MNSEGNNSESLQNQLAEKARKYGLCSLDAEFGFNEEEAIKVIDTIGDYLERQYLANQEFYAKQL